MINNHFGIYDLHCLRNLGIIVPGYIHNIMNQTQLLCHFRKGKDFEIGNWDSMQPLHKIYGLITYLTCTIYSYDKI
jgi:hypothetical protein